MFVAVKKKLEDFVDLYAEGGASIICEMLTDGVIGQLAPGATSIMLAHKQKRAERNLLIAIDEIKNLTEDLEGRLQRMPGAILEFLQLRVFPFLLDQIIDEQQEEKIKVIINGFNNVVIDRITDNDFIIRNNDILKNLRLQEITYFFELFYRSGDQQSFTAMNSTEVYMNNKLFQNALIEEAGFQLPNAHDETRKQYYRISSLGKDFVAFFQNH